MTSNAHSSRFLRRRPGAAAVALAAATVLLAGCSSSDDSDDPLDGGKADGSSVVVGSNNFAESILLADIYGEALKAKGIKVSYKPNIGSRETTYGLLKNGSITVLPEYNGSLLAYLDAKAEQTSLQGVNAAVKAKLDAKLTLLESSPAEDKDSVTVNAQTAKKYNLTSSSTLADLKDAAPELVLGGSPEFQTRQQGMLGLESVYGLKFKSFKALDAGGPLTQAALKKNTVQAADVFTTDPTITKEKFVVLQDPKNLFGFANVTPLVYKSGLSQEGVAALDAVSAKLDTKTLLDLDSQVQLENKDPLDVAKAWLKTAGLD
ncbi:ABC transporter substrate-binding protein [Streptomyces longwoodensis]|uniref:ABC transporter substrate-binding protein n=1 Tax=Streptomyces lasalocidi TaxID=324833 RepID=A0A4U5WRL7_STRLS|nr:MULTISPECIES: ABC transporter substrate-binding protein [Streptomyces]MCX4996567.1 ABC transporter substrate-binding protein [Streptomyces longwoodensis]TKT03356.1 ABC transporter substrate-binding protein [Streptomyces lasalocidi]WRY91252.1 ABC transporter substrate-binding protein [Streptomyces longwoodensis]WTI44453.1 ABC transporter substrate-binding protein [Streptomyces longwoodensis]WUC57250.1 ABC transporter substrate-binding protein [Streptomyces longwoodensis]